MYVFSFLKWVVVVVFQMVYLKRGRVRMVEKKKIKYLIFLLFKVIVIYRFLNITNKSPTTEEEERLTIIHILT